MSKKSIWRINSSSFTERIGELWVESWFSMDNGHGPSEWQNGVDHFVVVVYSKILSFDAQWIGKRQPEKLRYFFEFDNPLGFAPQHAGQSRLSFHPWSSAKFMCCHQDSSRAPYSCGYANMSSWVWVWQRWYVDKFENALSEVIGIFYGLWKRIGSQTMMKCKFYIYFLFPFRGLVKYFCVEVCVRFAGPNLFLRRLAAKVR